jgi:O-6-methylguanine DNA methyltransferase
VNSNNGLIFDLARSTDATPGKLAELRVRLAAAAERDGILDITYRVVGSPVGPLLVSYGHTASYVAVARLAGNPKAFRAVGSACAANPLPVIVPCHRVVRADGGIGGYLGGVQAKRTLLSLEAGVSRGPGRDRSRGRADTAEAVA